MLISKNKNGFTLLEIVITIGIMVLTLAGISRLYTTYLRLTAEEKFKITAASLANQKLETIRNLPYNLVGTIGGVPGGNIPQTETVTRNNYDYTVTTEIIYIDDPFDGTLVPGELESPYRDDNPDVTFYWNMDDASSGQSPQIGSGTITTSASLSTVEGVDNLACHFSPPSEMDYAKIPATNNLDTNQGRIAFWYKPDSKNISDDLFFFAASGCNGSILLYRDNSNKLEMVYGQSLMTFEYISTHPLQWEIDHWYLIEVMYDSINDEIAVYRDNEEVGYETSGNIEPPLNCSFLYIGNTGPFSEDLSGGAIDEFFILDNPNPASVPGDLLNTDYKRIKVTVTWTVSRGVQEIYMITDIAPPGIESNEGGGTMVINVFDSEGIGVNGANIHIYNDNILPIIDLNLETNSSGQLILPGVPTDENYDITVTKTSYSTDRTYEPTGIYTTPVRSPISIVEGQTTEVGFSIDRISELTIQTVSKTLPGNWQINTGVTTTDQINSSLAANDNYFYYVWKDFRDGTDPKSYGQKYSTLGTKQWTNDISLSIRNDQQSPKIALDTSGNIYTVWSDPASSNYDIFLSKHSSAGADVWGSSKKAHNDSSTADQITPDIIYGAGKLHVAWQDKRNDEGDIYFNILDTDGVKLLAADVKINTDIGTAIQTSPKIVKDQNNDLIIGWIDNRDSIEKIYLAKIDDTGNHIWTGEKQVNNESPSVTHNNFDITTDTNDDIYIAWSDTRDVQHNIYWQKFASSSAKMFTDDQNLATVSPTSQQIDPQIAGDQNGDIYFTWSDNRSGDHDIFLHKITSTGTAIWTQEIQVNLESDGDQSINDIGIYQTDKVVVSWTDYHEGYGNIWTGTVDPSNPETPVPYVDFDLFGAKLIYENPDLLKYENSFTTNAQGEITISNLEWDTYDINVTDVSYSYVQSTPEKPFFLSAATSTDIIIVIQ